MLASVTSFMSVCNIGTKSWVEKHIVLEGVAIFVTILASHPTVIIQLSIQELDVSSTTIFEDRASPRSSKLSQHESEVSATATVLACFQNDTLSRHRSVDEKDTGFALAGLTCKDAYAFSRCSM